MFSEPTINSVSHLFSAPGLGLELVGLTVLSFCVVCYLTRVAWIALSHARRMEMEALQVAVATRDVAYDGPYCAG